MDLVGRNCPFSFWFPIISSEIPDTLHNAAGPDQNKLSVGPVLRMKIALVGQIDVDRVADLVGSPAPFPVHSFPLTADLARIFVNRGHSVRMVVLSSHSNAELTTYGSREVSVSIVHQRRARRAIPDWFRMEVLGVARAIEDYQPDAVSCHWTYEYARGVLRTRFPHVITAHDVPTRLFSMLRPRYYHWPRLMQGFLVSARAKLMTAQSPYTLRLWKTEMRRRGPMCLVPNGVAPQLTAISASGGDANVPVFVSVNAGFQPRKNTKTLIKSFFILRRSYPSARLRLYGSGFGQGEEANQWASRRGLEGGVEFVGHTPNAQLVEELASTASVLVHPALEESFGMAVAEAMAIGLPVVGGRDSGAIPWLLDEGRAGFLCDVRSPADLADTMARALGTRNIAVAGKRRIAENFMLDKVADQYLELLAQAADRS